LTQEKIVPDSGEGEVIDYVDLECGKGVALLLHIEKMQKGIVSENLWMVEGRI
jgi:hypothetical protein